MNAFCSSRPRGWRRSVRVRHWLAAARRKEGHGQHKHHQPYAKPGGPSCCSRHLLTVPGWCSRSWISLWRRGGFGLGGLRQPELAFLVRFDQDA